MNLFATVIIALLLSTSAFAQGVVTAKPSASVTRDVVTLGDLFAGLESGSDIVIAQAPPVGRQLVLDAAWLNEAARAHKIAWKPATRFDRVVVERATQSIGADQITSAVMASLSKLGVGGDHDVQFDTRSLSLVLPAGEKVRLDVRDARFEERSERLSATVVATAGTYSASLPVAGQATRMMSIPSPARRIERGEVVSARDLRWIRVRAAAMPQDAAGTEAAIIGKAARRTLAAGEPVRMADVQAPVLVEKGALVTMIVQTPLMTLTAQGKALDDGALGETVRVANARSKKVVEAQVARADTVIIPLAQTP